MASGGFAPKVVGVALATGVSTSAMWSAFRRPTIDVEMPATPPVKAVLASGSFCVRGILVKVKV